MMTSIKHQSLILCIELNIYIFCLFAGIPPVGTHSNSVTGKKGGNITLQENNKNMNLIRRSKSILDCQNGKCEKKTANVQGICKEGVCDIVIKNLSFSDAGKYILRYSHTNDPTEKVQQNKYQLHIQGKVKTEQTCNMCFLAFLSNCVGIA